MLGDVDYQELNARVEAALKKRKMMVRYILFGVSVFMFVLFSVLAWAMASGSDFAQNISNTGSDDPVVGALIMFTMGWLTTLFLNGIGLAIDAGLGEKQMRSQVLTEELGQNLAEMVKASAEKPKRASENISDESDVVELSDDGELIPVEKRIKQ